MHVYIHVYIHVYYGQVYYEICAACAKSWITRHNSYQWNAVFTRPWSLGPVLLVLTTRIIYHRNWEAIHSHNHSMSHTIAT